MRTDRDIAETYIEVDYREGGRIVVSLKDLTGNSVLCQVFNHENPALAYVATLRDILVNIIKKERST